MRKKSFIILLFLMIAMLVACQSENIESLIDDTTFVTTETTISPNPYTGESDFEFPHGIFAKHFCETDFVTYKKMNRQLKMSDFDFLYKNMTRDEVYSLLGEPNGVVGNKWGRPYYELTDGTYIVLDVNSAWGESPLYDVIHVELDGNYTRQWMDVASVDYESIDFLNSNYLKQFEMAAFAIYKKMDRQLTYADFSVLNLGMTYSESLSLVGEPNGILEGRRPYPYYELIDGTYLILIINSASDTALLQNLLYVDLEGNCTCAWNAPSKEPLWEEDGLRICFPNNRTATYKVIDRQLTLDDFNAIKLDMTFDEIVALIGEPNGITDLSPSRYYYELSDKTYMILIMPLNSKTIGLSELQYLDADGNYTWVFGLLE